MNTVRIRQKKYGINNKFSGGNTGTPTFNLPKNPPNQNQIYNISKLYIPSGYPKENYALRILTLGTQYTLLGKPKLITLSDVLCNQAPRALKVRL